MQLNPSKPFLGIFAMLVLLYIVYTLLSTSPLDRLNRICTPVTLWPGRVVVAGTDIFSEGYSENVDQAFIGAFDVCRRWGWNVFYARDYAKLQAEQERAQREGGVPQAVPRSPSDNAPVPPLPGAGREGGSAQADQASKPDA